MQREGGARATVLMPAPGVVVLVAAVAVGGYGGGAEKSGVVGVAGGEHRRACPIQICFIIIIITILFSAK